jgi:hypothetical protein
MKIAIIYTFFGMSLYITLQTFVLPCMMSCKAGYMRSWQSDTSGEFIKEMSLRKLIWLNEEVERHD